MILLHKLKWILPAVGLAILSGWILAWLRITLFGAAVSQTETAALSFFSIIRIIFLSPAIEEWIFREKLPKLFAKRLKLTYAVLLSNLLFAVIHLDWFFPPYFVNGLIYAWSYKKSDSLAAPIAAHSLYNLFVFIVSSFL